MQLEVKVCHQNQVMQSKMCRSTQRTRLQQSRDNSAVTVGRRQANWAQYDDKTRQCCPKEGQWPKKADQIKNQTKRRQFNAYRSEIDSVRRQPIKHIYNLNMNIWYGIQNNAMQHDMKSLQENQASAIVESKLEGERRVAFLKISCLWFGTVESKIDDVSIVK